MRRAVLMGLLLVAGCAGFRGGVESLAYLGDSPPELPADPLPLNELRGRAALRVPGAQLQVTIDNRLRTYDTQVYLYALPLSIDPRNVYAQNNAPGKTRVFVNITPSDPSFVFEPWRAVLRVAGKTYRGSAGFDFGMWDADGKRVAKGGQWQHRPVHEPFALAEAGRRYYLSIDFDTPTPSPESREISLDLADALRSSLHPALPPIRFAPVRWKEGYT